MSIAAVIIARDEAKNLPALAQCLREFPFDEIIYVDSASTDASVEIAQKAGWRIGVLSPEGVLSASAGRHVGTLLSQADWILYLDGDMIPNLKTVSLMIEYADHRAPDVVGVTGDFEDRSADGRRRVQVQKARDGGSAAWLPGSGLLNRQAVLDAGNWNPNVYADEEWELYARLRERGGRLIYFHQILFTHQSPALPTGRMVFRLLGLYDWRNPRNGGTGYAIRAAIQARSIFHLVALRPEYFIVPLGTILLLVLALGGFPQVAVFALLILALWVAVRRGLRLVPVCYLVVPQMVIGILRYRERPVHYRVLPA